jgi:hypothetical protein
MPTTPPPYENITGISRAAMKDNAQETIENYNGVARPGELVVDQLTDNLYVGDPQGNLTLVGPTLLQTAIDDTSITLSQANQNQQILLTSYSTVYVPLNANAALPIGYAVTLVVGDSGSAYVRPQGEGDMTIYVSGQSGASVENDYDNVEIPQWTLATLLKVNTNTWIISGSGLTENYC